MSIEENASLESCPINDDGGDDIGIHSVASKIHSIDCKSKKG